jgi:penicillin-binding protein 1A
MALPTRRAIRVFAALGLLALVAGLGAALGFYLAFLRDLPDLRSVADYRPPLASRVYDRDGHLIGEFYVERRRLTPFEAVPEYVVRAFVAGEDAAFFEHSGIDMVSILRAAWVNLMAGGEIKQGASTITQQMVKGLLLSPERTLRRKIREMILARAIEQRFTKQEILYLYLNQIYFGHGAYGIGEAASTYFDKPVEQLTVSEAALLAGLPKAPSRYSPFANPKRAEERRRYVLGRMLENGYLDEAAHAAALADVPVLTEGQRERDFAAAAYFTEDVRRQLFDALGGETVLKGGLDIHTTLDLELQRSATAAVRKGLVELSHRQGYRGPLRQVAREEIPAELVRVAEANGLLAPAEAGEAAPAEAAPAPTPVPADAKAAASALTPEREEPVTGVVLAVDAKAQTARIGLAPDVEGSARLADLDWARPFDPDRQAYTVDSIAKVLKIGDVCEFLILAPEAEDPPDTLRLALHQEPLVEGALVSLELDSGEVLALVGGYDYARSQFDRATQSRRQPGSAFKPLIYAAALSKGYTPASIILDRPVVYTDEFSGQVWRPRNYGRSFYGPITLREALARSVNNATVHLFRDVGVDYVIDYAKHLGIESPLERNLSLALGSSVVSLLELTRTFAVFGHQGRRVTPIFIRRVEGRDGEVLIEKVELRVDPNGAPTPAEPDSEAAGLAPVAAAFEDEAEAVPAEATPGTEATAPAFPAEPGRLLPPEQAYLVTDMLRAVVIDPHGTGGRLRELGRPVVGKTGTTNDQADAWFIGFSPDVATGVWVGHDVARFLGPGETGARAAAPIWVDYMRAALAERPVRDFPVPEAIVFARIDRKTGLLADANSTETVIQSFLADTVPTEGARSAQTRSEDRRMMRMEDF